MRPGATRLVAPEPAPRACETARPDSRRNRMERLADFVLAHKRLLVAAWLLPALLGFATLSHSTGALTQRYDLPGYAGYEASQAIARTYGTGGGSAQPLVAVVQVPGGVAAHRSELAPRSPGSAAPFPARGSPRMPRPATGRSSPRRADDLRARLPAALAAHRTGDGRLARRGPGGARGRRVGGAPIRLTGADALGKEAGTAKGPASSRSRCSAPAARSPCSSSSSARRSRSCRS